MEGHTWTDKDNWGYRGYESKQALNDAYHELVVKLRPLIDSGLAAAVYTQTTDVETEVNGLLTYDRAVNKFDVPRAAAAHALLYEPPRKLVTVMPTSIKGNLQSWRYTKERPAEDWVANNFDDAVWKVGQGGFGSASSPAAIVGTQWTEPDIWLRRTLVIDGAPPKSGYWRIHHDEDAEVYVNGKLVQTFPGYTQSATLVPLSADTIAAAETGEEHNCRPLPSDRWRAVPRSRDFGGGRQISDFDTQSDFSVTRSQSQDSPLRESPACPQRSGPRRRHPSPWPSPGASFLAAVRSRPLRGWS